MHKRVEGVGGNLPPDSGIRHRRQHRLGSLAAIKGDEESLIQMIQRCSALSYRAFTKGINDLVGIAGEAIQRMHEGSLGRR